MKRYLALFLAGILAFVLPGVVRAEPKLATLNVTGMVCEG